MGLRGGLMMGRLAHDGASDRAVSEGIPSGDRHRVVAAGVPGMATGQTFRRKPAAVQRSESLHGLQGVLGAGRVEAATRTQERAHEPLVNANYECDGVAHCSVTFFQSAIRLACNSAPAVSRARPRALTTRSTAGSSRWCSLKDSRMIRRKRLRSTAPPAFLTDTANPSRAPPMSLGLAVTAKNPLPKRRPRA